MISEHKQCDNAATNANSENAKRRQVLQESVGTGEKEVESSTGKFWAAGFHHVRPVIAWRAF
jgi:hypothetical protein